MAYFAPNVPFVCLKNTRPHFCKGITKQIVGRHDTDQFAIIQNGQRVHLIGQEHVGGQINLVIGRKENRISRHEILGRQVVKLFLAIRPARGVKAQDVRGFGQILLANDAFQLVVEIQHRDVMEVVIIKNFLYLRKGSRLEYTDDVLSHDAFNRM